MKYSLGILGILFVLLAASCSPGTGTQESVKTVQIGIEPATQIGANWALELGPAGFNRPSRPALALSPDGRSLVYCGLGGEHPQIYIRSMEKQEAVRLAGTENGRDPFFSPDGQWVGFWSDNKLKRVSTQGGTPETICDANFPWGVSWGSNDIIVWSQGVRLFKVAASGGQPELLAEPSGEKGERRFLLPHILPEGDAILFTVQTSASRWKNPRVEALVLKTGERKVVLEEGADARYCPTGHLLFVRQGKLFAAPFDLPRLALTGEAIPILEDVMQAANATNASLNSFVGQYSFANSGDLAYLKGGAYRDPTRILIKIDRKGSADPLTSATKPYFCPRMSPSGTQLVYNTMGKQRDIWLYDIEQDTHRALASNLDFTTWPLWNPNGTHVSYYADSMGQRGIYLRRADGSGDAELLNPQGLPSSWSPNGETLAFLAPGEEGRNDIWALQIKDRRTEQVTKTASVELYPEFSPDGRYLAYTCNESGQYEIYVRPYPASGEPIRVTTGGAGPPAWGPGGSELFYLSGGNVMVVDIKLKPRFSIVGEPRILFEFRGKYGFGGTPVRAYDVTPDGQHFLAVQSMLQEAVPVTKINLISNWFKGLKGTDSGANN